LLEAQTAYIDKDPKKKGFPFLHCWLKTRHCEKFTPTISNKRPRRSDLPPAAVDVFDVEDDESRKSQTPDSSMLRSKRPMGEEASKGEAEERRRT